MVRTIGVAIGVPEPWGRRLDAHRRASGDPMARLIPAHITLLGPTKVAAGPQAVVEVEAHLARVAAEHRPFWVRLHGTDTFRPVTQVVFVAFATGVSECELLASSIRRGPLRRPLDFPYRPHVTVAHDVPSPALDAVFEELASFEAWFPVDGFTLYEQGGDGWWHPRRWFALGG